MFNRISPLLKFNRRFILSLLGLPFAFFFINHLLQSNYANGKDGYWYIIQLQSLIKKGELHSYESTLLYPLFYFWKIIVIDYVLALRYTLVTISLFCSLSLYYLYRFFSDKSRLYNGEDRKISINRLSRLNYVVILLFLFSPSVLMLAVQYPKQALALSLLNISMGIFLPLIKLYLNFQRRTAYSITGITEKNKLKLYVKFFTGLCFLVLALFSHRIIPPLLGIMVAGYLFFYIILIRNKRKKQIKPEKKKFVFNILTKKYLLIIIVILGIFSLFFFFQGIFHPADLKRLSGSKKLYMVFEEYLHFFNYQIVVFYEIFGFVLFMWSLYRLYINLSHSPYDLKNENTGNETNIEKNLNVEALPFLLTLSLMNFLFLLPIFDFFDLQIRLLGSVAIYSYMMIPVIAQSLNEKNKKYFVVVWAAISLFSLFHEAYFFYNPHKFEHDYQTFDKLISKVETSLAQNSPVLVVGHTGLAQYFEFKTGFEALPWAPEERFEKQKSYRFVYGIPAPLFNHRIEQYPKLLPPNYQKEVITCNRDYIFVREDLWDFFLKTRNLSYDELIEKALEFWKNPMALRPQYLFK